MKSAYRRGLAAAVFAVLCASPLPGAAQEIETLVPRPGTEIPAPLVRNHPEVLFAVSIFEGNQAFTIGADYEVRLHKNLGIGVLAEYAGSDIDGTVLAVPLYIHPPSIARVILALGTQWVNDDSFLLFRFGFVYDFRWKSYTISPTADFDIVNEKFKSVLGVAFGTRY